MATKLWAQIELPGGSWLKLRGLKQCTSVATLKDRIEQQAGILSHTYSLTYLDTSPLENGKTLRELNVVDGGTLKVVAWRLWHEVVVATLRGDVKICPEELRALGKRGDVGWRDHCGWCTVYTAAHCGHYTLLCDLLKEWPTVNINEQSSNGWTALHAAARMGQWKALCVLINNGADVLIKNKGDHTAADLAHNNGHKKCEQTLRFCEWNIKKYGIVQQRRQDYDVRRERHAASRRAHQYSDSQHSAWLPCRSEYMVHTPNPISVQDVANFKAKQQPHRPAVVKLPPLNNAATAGSQERVVFDYGWFDKLRAQQLVPTTQQILSYSDPSSTSLQPRSILNPSGYYST